MIEMLVVLAIVAILGGILATVGRSSSDATDTQAAMAVAHAYADAVDGFADEHGGRAPVPATTDWPVHVDSSQELRVPPDLQDFGAGPVNVAASGRPYMTKVPEPIRAGGVILSAAGGGTPADTRTDQTTRVAYLAGTGAHWRLDVQVRERAASGRTTWRTVCSFGPDAKATGDQKC